MSYKEWAGKNFWVSRRSVEENREFDSYWSNLPELVELVEKQSCRLRDRMLTEGWVELGIFPYGLKRSPGEICFGKPGLLIYVYAMRADRLNPCKRVRIEYGVPGVRVVGWTERGGRSNVLIKGKDLNSNVEVAIQRVCRMEKFERNWTAS